MKRRVGVDPLGRGKGGFGCALYPCMRDSEDGPFAKKGAPICYPSNTDLGMTWEIDAVTVENTEILHLAI